MILLNKLYLLFPVREISWDCLSSWIAEPRAKRPISRDCVFKHPPKPAKSVASLAATPLGIKIAPCPPPVKRDNVTTWLLPPMSFMLFPFLFKSFVDFVDFLFWFDRIWQDTFCYFLRRMCNAQQLLQREVRQSVVEKSDKAKKSGAKSLRIILNPLHRRWEKYGKVKFCLKCRVLSVLVWTYFDTFSDAELNICIWVAHIAPSHLVWQVCFAYVAGKCAFGRQCHDKHPDEAGSMFCIFV